MAAAAEHDAECNRVSGSSELETAREQEDGLAGADSLSALIQRAQASGLRSSEIALRVPFEVVDEDAGGSRADGAERDAGVSGFGDWLVGQRFVSLEEAESRIIEAALSRDVFLRKLRRDRRGKYSWLECVCAGLPSAPVQRKRAERRDCVRCDCRFRICVRECVDNARGTRWFAIWQSESHLEHLHSAEADARLHKRVKLSDTARSFIRLFWTLAWPAALSRAIRETLNVPCTARQVSNYVATLRGSPNQQLSDMMVRLQENEATFRVARIGDQLQCVTWTFPECVELAKRYGSLLILDATYATNAFGMPLLVYSGVDRHSTTITFGFSLVLVESAEACKCAFSQFKELTECSPSVVVTDAAPAYVQPVADVFGQPVHLWCMWHVAENVRRHMGARSGELLQYLYQLARELDKGAAQRVKSRMLHAFRDSSYVKGYIAANIRFFSPALQVAKDLSAAAARVLFFRGGCLTSQRSESMNSKLKQPGAYALRNLPLQELVRRSRELNARALAAEQDFLRTRHLRVGGALGQLVPCLSNLHRFVASIHYRRLQEALAQRVSVVADPDLRVRCRHQAEAVFTVECVRANGGSWLSTVPDCSACASARGAAPSEAATLTSCCALVSDSASFVQAARAKTCTDRDHRHFAAWFPPSDVGTARATDDSRVVYVVYHRSSRRIMCTCWQLVFDGLPCLHVCAVLARFPDVLVESASLVHANVMAEPEDVASIRAHPAVRVRAAPSAPSVAVPGAAVAEAAQALQSVSDQFARVARGADDVALARFSATLRQAMDELRASTASASTARGLRGASGPPEASDATDEASLLEGVRLKPGSRRIRRLRRGSKSTTAQAIAALAAGPVASPVSDGGNQAAPAASSSSKRQSVAQRRSAARRRAVESSDGESETSETGESGSAADEHSSEAGYASDSAV